MYRNDTSTKTDFHTRYKNTKKLRECDVITHGTKDFYGLLQTFKSYKTINGFKKRVENGLKSTVEKLLVQ